MEKDDAGFRCDMLEQYDIAKKECEYTDNRYLELISSRGGIGTAKRLLEGNQPAHGFVALAVERGRPELTVEALVVKRKWWHLFTSEEVEKARYRLREWAGWTEPGGW